MKLEFGTLPEVFREIFKFAEEQFATDIYIREGVPPFFKTVEIAGSAVRIKMLLYEALYEEAKERGDEEEAARIKERMKELPKEIPAPLKSKVVRSDIRAFVEALSLPSNAKEIDTSFTLHKGDRFIGRFRLNVALSDGSTILSIRRLYSYVPHPFDELRLPEVIGKVRQWNSGLVIVTGPTGSGKSTTLAGIMRYLSEDDRSRVVVTIEKPIEYVFDNKNAFFIQREVGRDTDSFISGVHNALRQHPDVIYIGESRTPEEIKTALMASETGHLTFTTLHTSSAWGVISRIVDVFPPDEQPQIRTILADQLKLVVAQRLVLTVDFAVRAVCEVLLVDEFVRGRIKEGDVKQIRDFIRRDRENCKYLNSELTRLVMEGVITKDTAMKVTYDSRELQSMLESSEFSA
ncbi:type II secretion system protein E (plasmid) [Thermovibrio ammonificans HB-1]|uniref:Type II secretion system protein E n=1 Tax=Thermovibrio ammonificans (strain DSM 15698 / JCM 12110 / HB-1) TaxID=648996 RepID=E8T6T2_THEA1|nr:ATPase, T2SS/T4P/T4SS family [Thermovibrio ammonificans]ADU97755.1 type II secretion system protein E [Thermovibrio ammonificans HB-1]